MNKSGEKNRSVSYQPRYVRGYIWKTRLRIIFSWVGQIAIAVAAAFACAYFFGHQVSIRETSMEPTLASGDTLLINSAAYVFDTPKRGDLIAFYISEDDKNGMQVKRVIGLPGETVLIENGYVKINGEIYAENADYPLITNPGMAAEPIELGPDEYFVLGDNRNNSEDSRHSDIGPVLKGNIEGKLWMRISPLDRMEFVE